MSTRRTRALAERAGGSKRSSALQRLRDERENGGRLAGDEDDDDNVFDEVSEEQYKRIVEERRAQSDFVVDDDGMGYHDDGEEHLFELNPEDEEELVVEDGKGGKKRGSGALSAHAMKRAKLLNQSKLGGQGQKIKNMFLRSAHEVGPGMRKSAAKSKSKAQRKAGKVGLAGAGAGQADLDLDSMLADLSANPIARRPKAKSRSAAAFFKAPAASRKAKYDLLFSDPSGASAAASDAAAEQAPDDDAAMADADAGDDDGAGQADADPVDGAAQPESEQESKPRQLSARERLFAAAREESITASAATKALIGVPATATSEKEVAAAQKAASSEGGEWWGIGEGEGEGEGEGAGGAAATAASVGQSAPGPASSAAMPALTGLPLEEDEDGKYLRMFWIDAYELKAQPGKVFLFGKVEIPDANRRPGSPQFVSCCAIVHDLQHQLLVLPRRDEEGNPFPMGEVYKEVLDKVMRKVIPAGTKQGFKCKQVNRKYCFEMTDVPREESQYLKVVYSAKYPKPNVDVLDHGGETFSKVFGGRTPVIENFLLKRKLMGPCWIAIRNVLPARSPMSWCRLEALVQGPKAVQKLKDPPPAPPLAVMSLSMKTVLNPRTHTHEVVAASAMLQQQVNLDGPTPDWDKRLQHFTVIRPLGTSVGGNTPFPHDFRQIVQRDPKLRRNIEITPNERGLLSYFLAKIHQADPDVIVGHNIHGFELDVILTRAFENKIPLWSKLGRLRRSKRPFMGNNNSNMGNLAASITCGRIIVDTYLSSRELLKQTTYTLQALVQQQLGKSRMDLDPVDVPGMFQSSDRIIRLAGHTNTDAGLVMGLMIKLAVMPLSKQLTNISGNLWNRTLKGARAERIEYLLMHEFHRLKYILPEKLGWKEKNDKGADDGDGNRRAGQSGRRKPAYSGGLVLEPKKGLYDSMVLLLDFASLYPSIIQEYNLCFSTVDRHHLSGAGSEEQELPPLPAEDSEKGILPRVIKQIVQRRRQVKKMMKSEKHPVKKQQYDIRQMALKLTANSMYGCLGFSNSRFFAKPIAALVTAKGRDTLQRTVEIAENTLNLEVIYGDTDSIMVNTKETDLAKVNVMGNQVVREVNKLFKELELEIDGVFKSMLLLKKKKYAALTIEQRKSADGKKTEVHYKREVKGLDMVRRDWCPLSKKISGFTLDRILSGDRTEDVVQKIHENLTEMCAQMRKGDIELPAFVITKGLNKAPNDYPDAKGQPHLQVALKMLKAGKHVNGELKLDIEWYLTQQIHPPVSRLIEPIEGTSSAAIAEHMGLDAARFRQSQGGGGDGEDDMADYLSRRMDDAERFKHSEPLEIHCRACGTTVPFPGVRHFPSGKFVGQSGLVCTNEACGAEFFGFEEAEDCVALLENKLTLSMRTFIKQYYDRWLVCEDSAATVRTQQQSVLGNRFFVNGHLVPMKAEYSDARLYEQIKYYETLFDVKRSDEKLKEQNEKRAKSQQPTMDAPIPEHHKPVFKRLLATASETVQSSAYNWVRPSLWSAVFSSK
eukprot:g600.t1